MKEYQSLTIDEGFLKDPPVGLSTEARQRIAAVRPPTLGALSRIPGMRATDVALVLMHLRKKE